MVTILRVLRQAGKTDKEILRSINKIQIESEGNRPEGLAELFCDLQKTGHTDSLNESRIYYLAYLLSRAGLQVEVGYKE